MNSLTFILASCVIGACGGLSGDNSPLQLASVETSGGPQSESTELLNDPFYGKNLSGNYLASQFAQRRHDWERAGRYLDDVIKAAPEDISLIKKAMVISMGAGDVEAALKYAEKVKTGDPENALAALFLITQNFKEQDYQGAVKDIETIPQGGLSEFILPVLKSWAEAGLGHHKVDGLNQNTIHVYHAILISEFLGKEKHIEQLLEKALSPSDIGAEDLSRIADIYAHLGKTERAAQLYEQVLIAAPGDSKTTQKLQKVKAGQAIPLFDKIESPALGAAEAMGDMAQLLAREYADDSARVFAHMGLYLNPKMDSMKLLLASIASRNDLPEDALAFYRTIGTESSYYLDAQHRAADLMEDEGKIDEAVTLLQSLADTNKDLEAPIKIGDIYRRHDDFQKALVYYNRAQEMLGGTITADYWHIHYVRGMTYEQLGQWDKAEADLEAALAFQPSHPFVLNYLGYAWADQGKNLDQSLELIRKALLYKPNDGYITDSLGWAYYRMGEYQKSVPHLERAVELLPYDPVINDHLGDAYWKVGRALEARFQWRRARNHSEDANMISMIDGKLQNGLGHVDVVKQASSMAKDETTKTP